MFNVETINLSNAELGIILNNRPEQPKMVFDPAEDIFAHYPNLKADLNEAEELLQKLQNSRQIKPKSCPNRLNSGKRLNSRKRLDSMKVLTYLSVVGIPFTVGMVGIISALVVTTALKIIVLVKSISWIIVSALAYKIITLPIYMGKAEKGHVKTIEKLKAIRLPYSNQVPVHTMKRIQAIESQYQIVMGSEFTR